MKSLLDLFLPPEDYRFCNGVGCTYSVNDKTLSELKRKLGISLDKKAMIDFEKGESFRLFFSQGKYEGEKAHNYLIPVSVDGGCLHAKVYLLRYDNKVGENPPYILRVIVASANLTNAEEHNVYAKKDFDDFDVDMDENFPNFFDNCTSVEALLDSVSTLLKDSKNTDFFTVRGKRWKIQIN